MFHLTLRRCFGSQPFVELPCRRFLARAEARASSSHPEHGGHNARKLGLDVLGQHAHVGQAAAQISVEGGQIDVRSLLLQTVGSLGVVLGEFGDGVLREAGRLSAPIPR